MSRQSVPFIGSKDTVNEVCESACNVKQDTLSSRLIVRNSGFKQVSGTVEFVHDAEVLPPLCWLNQRKIGIQITIRLLTRGDL